MRRLAVSLDALAALRELTGARDVDLQATATVAGLAGVDALRLGLSEELRPVAERDVRDVGRAAPALELRLAPAPGLLKIALEAQPTRVVLASERRDAPAWAHPLDFSAWGVALAPAVRSLRQAGIAVAVLVNADLESVKAAHAADAAGVEFYTADLLDLPGPERASALERLAHAARLAAKLRLAVGLAGGLGLRNAELAVDAAPVAEWVCVGRAFVARALLVGIERTVRDLRPRIG